MIVRLCVAALLAASSLSASAAAVDYGGKWTLDKSRSVGLPPFYSQVASHTLDNTQDDRKLVVDIDIAGLGPTPSHASFEYRLDGTPTTAVTEVHTPAGVASVPTTMVARVDAAGQVHIAITREVPMNGKVVKGESSEDWNLSADGQVLTVHLVRNGQASDLVFTRM
jgi:hypothetical protein